MTEETELTALAAQRRGIWGRTHTEEHDGKPVAVTWWGTESTYIEESELEGMHLLTLKERNAHGIELPPVCVLLTLADLQELDLVLSVYLNEYVKDKLGVQEVGA